MAKKKTKKVNVKNQRPPVSKPNYQKWFFAAGVFLFAFLLYANTINHGFVLDDDLVCKKNDFVQNGVNGIKDIFTHSWYYGLTDTPDRYYRPMMLASFAVETSLFGNSPRVYHVMNVLYYALGCTLLFFVISLLLKNKNLLIPLAATLLFAAHPLHTEVVANIKSRDEIFAFLGLLGVIYGIVKYNQKNNIGFLVLALSSYFFAILSKEAALTFLGVVPLVLYFFTKTSFQKISIQTVFFGILAAIYFFIRMGIVDDAPKPFEVFDNSLFAIEGMGNRLATAFSMIGEYFKLLIFPHPLSFDYTYNTFPEVGWTNWKSLSALAATGGLIYLTIKGLRSKNIFSFSILFFAITFVITSNIFFLIGATFAERFMFIPLLGFCIAVSVLLGKYLDLEKKKTPTAFYSFLGVILLLYTAKTVTRNQVWENDQTLFETGIETAPNSCRTQSFFGVINYRKAQQTQDANLKKQYLNTSVEYLTKSINTLPQFTETHQHLALTYEAQNQTDLAIQSYKNALATNPEYFNALTNMGILYYKNNNFTQAETYLKQSLAIAPNNIITTRALGLVYKASNQFNLAIQTFERALSLRRGEQQLIDLGMLYEQIGNTEKAMFYDDEIKKLRQKK